MITSGADKNASRKLHLRKSLAIHLLLRKMYEYSTFIGELQNIRYISYELSINKRGAGT